MCKTHNNVHDLTNPLAVTYLWTKKVSRMRLVKWNVQKAMASCCVRVGGPILLLHMSAMLIICQCQHRQDAGLLIRER